MNKMDMDEDVDMNGTTVQPQDATVGDNGKDEDVSMVETSTTSTITTTLTTKDDTDNGNDNNNKNKKESKSKPQSQSEVEVEVKVKEEVEEIDPNREKETCSRSSQFVREGEHVLLTFADGRQFFAECLSKWRGKGSPPLKINKRSYYTRNLIGLPFGTVLELDFKRGVLIPLPCGEDIVPDPVHLTAHQQDPADQSSNNTCQHENNTSLPNQDETTNGDDNDDPINKDNRHLVDNNTSQSINQDDITQMRTDGVSGSTIVAKIISSSSTFQSKTSFSKHKYIRRKQIKYQPRCRLVRCTGRSIATALYLKDSKKMNNMREDTLGQILSYANVCAGSKVLLFDGVMGIVLGSLAQRMGGYGRILSLYTGHQPAYLDMLSKFNLSFGEMDSIAWLHAGEVFEDDHDADSTNVDKNKESAETEEQDLEKMEREKLHWPCPLQPHTKAYLQTMDSRQEKVDFLNKRSARFARKLTRHTVLETRAYARGKNDIDDDDDNNDDDDVIIRSKPNVKPTCDSLIIVTKYDPTATLLQLLPYLKSSCPFVLYYEFLEPLLEAFRALQDQHLCINLRLSDTWMREYQVLPGRTHPNMNMSGNGGFILTGIKLCPKYGRNELNLSGDVLREIRGRLGGRRGKKPKRNSDSNAKNGDRNGNNGNGKGIKHNKRNPISKEHVGGGGDRVAKRAKAD